MERALAGSPVAAVACQVPTDEARVRLHVHEAALHREWLGSLPTSHLSSAAAIVLYQLSDRQSFEAAQRW